MLPVQGGLALDMEGEQTHRGAWVDDLRQGGGIIYEGKKLNYLFMEDGEKGIVEKYQKREINVPKR